MVAGQLAGRPDNFDFSGFYLTNSDGTVFTITRTNLGTHDYLLESVHHAVTSYGKAKLTKIQTAPATASKSVRRQFSTTMRQIC